MGNVLRYISDRDRKSAERLRLQWNKQKRTLGMTQAVAAKKIGFSQSALNQYLNCTIPLNTDAVLSFARLLECRPEEIDPNFRERISLLPQRVPVISTTTRSKPSKRMIEIKRKTIYESTYGVQLDTDMTPLLPQGTIILCSPEALLREKDQVLIQTREGYALVAWIGMEAEGIIFCDLPYSSHHDQPKTLTAGEVLTWDKVIGYDFP